MASSNLTAAERAMMQRKHLAAVQASDLAFASGDRAGGQRWAQIGDQLAERLWGGERIVDGVRTA